MPIEAANCTSSCKHSRLVRGLSIPSAATTFSLSPAGIVQHHHDAQHAILTPSGLGSSISGREGRWSSACTEQDVWQHMTQIQAGAHQLPGPGEGLCERLVPVEKLRQLSLEPTQAGFQRWHTRMHGRHLALRCSAG